MCYPTVKVRVLFFAKSRELAGTSEVFVQLPHQIPYQNLLNYLCRKFNLEIIRNNIIIALNENYCEDKDAILKLKDKDEIAVIPPISGG